METKPIASNKHFSLEDLYPGCFVIHNKVKKLIVYKAHTRLRTFIGVVAEGDKHITEHIITEFIGLGPVGEVTQIIHPYVAPKFRVSQKTQKGIVKTVKISGFSWDASSPYKDVFNDPNIVFNYDYDYLTEEKENDPINPNHYKQGGIELKDFIKPILENPKVNGYEGGLMINIVKYVTRHKEKNGIEDLKKARWFLEELINYQEKQ